MGDSAREAPARYSSQVRVRYASEACASSRSADVQPMPFSAGASRPVSVPPYRTPQTLSQQIHKPVPVSSWSHVSPQSQNVSHSELLLRSWGARHRSGKGSTCSVPREFAEESVSPALVAAQEATSEVVRRMMDSMGGFEMTPQLSTWMEAANARRRRFMDPQRFQG